MPSPSEPLIAYAVTPQAHIHLTNCGRLDLVLPTPQSKRVRNCFVAYIVLKGELNLVDFLPSGPEQFRMRAGDIHIIAPELYQASTKPSAPGTRMIWIHFSFFGHTQVQYLATAEDAAAVLYTSGANAPALWILPRHMQLAGDLDSVRRLCAELNDYVRLNGTNNMGSHQICGHLVTTLHRILSRRILHADTDEESSTLQAHVAHARNFILMNYDKRISLSEVADAVGLSSAYLSRCFRKSTGQSVVTFLLRTRIQAAKNLLSEQGSPSVKEIAFQTGFASPIYFCRVFRRLEKKTAMEYAASVRRKARRRS